MLSATFLPALTELLRLVNNLIEGEPMAQRQAAALAWYSATWPLVSLFLPADAKKQIESIMSTVTAKP